MLMLHHHFAAILSLFLLRAIQFPPLAAVSVSKSAMCVGCNLALEGQFPYVVFIIGTDEDSRFSCTGTIISDRDILTARHCTPDGSELTVTAGIVDVSSGGDSRWVQSRKVETVKPYPNADFAIMTLATPLEIDTAHVSPVPLSTIDPTSSTFKNPIVVGFGLDTADPHHLRLRYTTQVAFVNDEECNWRLQQDNVAPIDGENEVCVTSPKGIGGCYGDSGSPLITSSDAYGQHPKIVGVLSAGAGEFCGDGELEVYEAVAKHVRWIAENAEGTVRTIAM